MSIFEFTDQLGFSPPVVFEEENSSEDGFYEGAIDYYTLGKQLAKSGPFDYNYRSFKSGRTNTLTINALDGMERDPREVSIPLELPDKEGRRRELNLRGRLNRSLGVISKRQGKAVFDFELTLGKEIKYIKRIKYASSEQTAIEISTNLYEDYRDFSTFIGIVENDQVRNKIIKKFNQEFNKADGDAASLKWLYDRAPQFVVKEIGDERLVEDLKLLISYDQNGALSWFKDSSTAIMNLLTGFQNIKVLYNYFYKHPEVVIDIYSGLEGEAVEQFTYLLTSLAYYFNPDESQKSIVEFRIGSNYSLNSNLRIANGAKTIQLENYEYVKVGTTERTEPVNMGMVQTVDKYDDVIIDQQQTFHPLDVVALVDSVSGEKHIVCALYVKQLSDEAEWREVTETIVVVVSIIGILVSAGTLAAGASGFVAAIAIADIAVSVVDIATVTRRRDLKGTEEGNWLDENWNKISGSFAILSVGSALRQGLIKNGPGILAKLRGVKNASAAGVRKRIQVLLFQLVINQEIAGFGSVSFKIVSVDQIRLIRGLTILQSRADRLWRLGVSVLEGTKDGKSFVALMYKGEVIASGVPKKMDEFVKNNIFTHGITDSNLVKYLDELAAVSKSLIPIKSTDELISFLGKINDNYKAVDLEKVGIKALFRGTTRIDGKLFSGNLNSIEHGLSTSTDPLRAIIFAMESAGSRGGKKGFLQIVLPNKLEGIRLGVPNRRYPFELEVRLKMSTSDFSNLTILDIPIEKARSVASKFFTLPEEIPTSISDPRNARELIEEIYPKVDLEEAFMFYEELLKIK